MSATGKECCWPRLAVREQSSFVEATWWFWSDVVLAGLSTLTCGQAAHSYWWIRPSRLSRRTQSTVVERMRCFIETTSLSQRAIGDRRSAIGYLLSAISYWKCSLEE